MAGQSVGTRLKNLNEKVRAACIAWGRDPATVKVLAVSKLQPLSAIREAYESGQRDFAENYVQEAVDKQDQLHSLPVDWHFIGRIQSNKVKALAGRFNIIHSVDRSSIAEALQKATQNGRRQDIFLQFNVAAEASKGGVGENELKDLVHFVVESCSSLRVLGLMVMPPLDTQARVYFRRARELQDALRSALSAEQRAAHPFNELSMGTTADYAEAIAEGATWIRIGTEIFGAREEKE
ncbi:MAG: YggS family pyridoxal phosphate-dependent enzyme [Bdellovibrionales bacterium]|nr:YggS family pyridoxal phosphate-dependent enzyme [Bdellovibrionales bacterium]